MSHIVEFTIAGLVGRKDTYSRQLNDDINVFFGLNGCGKTSLLKILHSAMSNDTDILKNVPFEDAQVKIYSVNDNQSFTRTIQVKNDNTPLVENEPSDFLSLLNEVHEIPDEEVKPLLARHTRSDKKIAWVTEPKLPIFNKGLRHKYLPTSRLYLGGKGIISHPRVSEEHLDRYFALALQELWARYSADIDSAIRKAQAEGLTNILKAILSTQASSTTKDTSEQTDFPVDFQAAYGRVSDFLKRQGQDAENILGPLQNFEGRYSNEIHLRKVVTDINEVEKEIEKAMAPRRKLQQLLQEMFSGNKTIQLQDQSIEVRRLDNLKLGLQTLSSGEKQLLWILLETLLAGESCILLDEPEISMHIDWQRELITGMRQLNPSAQIIVTTHSPEIMADFEDDRIFRI